MSDHKAFSFVFSKIYSLYVQKAEKNSRTEAEVIQIICWLTGYNSNGLTNQIESENYLATFFAEAPTINSNVSLIKGVVCEVHVEDIEEPLMRKIRYLDKLIDELAKGKSMEKILRSL
ncbi:DUF2200 domain-containing protein [Parashewanella spongiae]|uniref:DUF2200 domain-containing protein n=1 Tax=Parashewanella spongiae TaxID=342950 RepID=A0A3A6U5K3_9GAMM|nr:DUF2200 domain-containing protein [Parashewanella spongiae]MCL1076746.1 DUF2200 domain-containing protein [Parashewanella spongiae]RJY19488.1 DUF2200 domain-containing protein [Parashewanella spongiae]